MRVYVGNLLLALDQLANAITGGDPDESVSSRIGKCQRGDRGMTVRLLVTPLAWAIDLAFIWQGWGHCARCIEDDEGSRDLVLKD